MHKLRSLSTAALLVYATLGASSASAALFDFHGTFSDDTDVQFFTFTLDNPSSVSITTTSYAGGGFFPQIVLWDVNGNNAGVPSGFTFPAPPSDYTMAYDFTGYTPTPTTFYMAVVVFDRPFNPSYPAGALSGDLPGGLPDPAIFDPGYSTAIRFGCDPANNFWDSGLCSAPRHNDWALKISGADVSAASLYPPAAVPEPGTLALFGCAGLAPLVRRRLS